LLFGAALFAPALAGCRKTPNGSQHRHCERSEAIQKANKINASLDRHVGLRPPRDDGTCLFQEPAGDTCQGCQEAAPRQPVAAMPDGAFSRATQKLIFRQRRYGRHNR
jgi:hypothetical protein